MESAVGNPYQATDTGGRLEYPIYFAGTLTRDDLMMSLHDTVPRRGFSRLQYPLMLVALTCAIPLAYLLWADANGPVPALVWPVAAGLALPTWIALIRFVSPSHRKRVRRLKLMAGRQERMQGWLEESQLVIYDQWSAFRGKWSFYSSVFIFPTHLLIPLGVDASQRVVLPYRFFCSPSEARQACEFLRDKLGSVVNKPPGDRQLDKMEFDPSAGNGSITVQQANDWNSESWPIGSNEEDHFDWTIDLTAQSVSFWFALKAALIVFALMLWYCLPMWAAVAAWLITDYRFFGDWDFLFDRGGSTAVVLGPAAILFAVFAYAATRAATQIWRLRSQPMQIQLRSSGLHLSHESFDMWMAWSSVRRVVTSEKSAGWVLEESEDEVLYPPACFDGSEDFERFKAVLRRLGPG